VNITNPARAADISPRAGKSQVGHPVDVATGVVFSTQSDIALIPGKVWLEWERTFTSSTVGELGSALGRGWSSRYFASLRHEASNYLLRAPEGGTLVLADPKGLVETGQILRDLPMFQELERRGSELVLTRWDTETGEIERFVFGGSSDGETWPLIAIEDVTGQALDLVHDSTKRVIEVRQRLEGRSLVIAYDEAGQVSSVSLSLSAESRTTLAHYEYDPDGHLIAAYDALGNADRYEYDEHSRLVREFARDGGVFHFRYDARGRCTRTTGLDRYDEKTLRYFDAVHWTEVTDSLGGVRRYHYNGAGQVVEEIDPRGGRSTTEYDDYGRITALSRPSGATTRFLYDDAGNVSAVLDALGRETLFSYDERHLMTARTCVADGRTWRFGYDSEGRLVVNEDPLGARWQVTYDERGNAVRITDPDGASTGQRFTANGLLQEVTDGEGNTSRFLVNDMNRVIQRIDPADHVTRYAYNLLGHLEAITFPDGTMKRWETDSAGNVTAVIDASGSRTEYRFGPCRRLVERVDALGHMVRFRWGTEPGHLTEIINEKGETTRFERDALGRIEREIDFDGRELRCAYDFDGHLIETITETGRRTTFQRDVLGQLLTQTLADGTVRTYQYDVDGYVLEARSEDSVVRFERDPNGRVLRETQGSYSVSSRYAPVGSRMSLATSLGLRVDYAMDRNRQLSTLTIDDRHTFAIQRDALGNEATRRLPGGHVLGQVFSPNRQLVEQVVTQAAANSGAGSGSMGVAPTTLSGRQIIRRRYRYSVRGDLSSMEDAAWGAIAVHHDAAERLVEWRSEQRGLRRFRFDPCSNLVEIATDRGRKVSLEYGAGSRLARRDGSIYEYDSEGNLTRKIEQDPGGKPREWRYAWDASNQLRELTTPEGETWTYSYDAFGRRLSKCGAGKSIAYVWDGDVLVHAFENGAQLESWVFDPHGFTPLCKLQDGQCYSVVVDSSGTPRELLDRAGRVVWSILLDAWGSTEVIRGRIDCDVRFPGQWYDTESGLCYNRFRYYDPQTASYISADPIGVDGNLNPYSYVRDPFTSNDLFGLHGNSASSTNPQHVYMITDNQTGQVYKYGISGQPLNSNGSPRANSQTNRLNQQHPKLPDGSPRFSATVIASNVPNRKAALSLEQHFVNSHANQDPHGRAPVGNTRPKPNKQVGPCAR
jgi:RHS repeat-associated protein